MMCLNIKVDFVVVFVVIVIFNFDFIVIDYDVILIYFFGFDGIVLLVNMDLCYDFICKVVGGYEEVDMCLYDGVGLQSEFFGVIVCDSGL